VLRKKRSKKPTAKDYEAIIKIQERIIIAHEKRIAWQEKMYIELWCDGMDLKDAYEKCTAELELAYKDRNEAIRRYNALHELGEMAESAGVDLTAKLPENEKVKWKDYKFNIKGTVLESGKTAYSASLNKNLSHKQQEFSKLHNKGKKKT
jgi:uncharacterized protein YfcZ (UPF0381/DUF406 family)